MAHFRARVQGHRGEAARLGTKKAGIFGNVAGWRSGVSVAGQHHEPTDTDTFHITVTAGNGWGRPAGDGFIGRVLEGGRFEPSQELRDRIIQEWAESNRAVIGAG